MDQPIERAPKGLGTLGGPNAIPATTAMAACEMIKGTIISYVKYGRMPLETSSGGSTTNPSRRRLLEYQVSLTG